MTLSHTILRVDDDVDDLHLLKKAIASIDTKYEIIEAYNGVEALEKLSEMRAADKLPSLIVMDINMPKMDKYKNKFFYRKAVSAY